MRRVVDGGPDGARGAALPPRQNSTVAAGGLRRALQRIIRRVIGAPDYEGYLEHCRAAGHAPKVDEREYVKQFFENKGKAPRCC